MIKWLKRWSLPIQMLLVVLLEAGIFTWLGLHVYYMGADDPETDAYYAKLSRRSSEAAARPVHQGAVRP